jgi:hypothetical protein
MNIDKFMFAFMGAVVFISVLLGYFWHPAWLLLTGFVGLNAFQAAFTGFCPAAIVLKKLGLKPGQAFG